MSSAISQLLEIQTTSCGYVYNRELITQPLPISHSPRFFSQIHVSDGVIKNILVSIISVTFNLDACKVSFLNYL